MLTLVQDLPRSRGSSGVSRPLESSFGELRDLGREAAEAGDLTGALEHLDAALEVARTVEDKRLIDHAVCNRSAVLITLGRQRETKPALREILVSGSCLENSFLAAFQLSRAHVRDKSAKKGLFYAQVARDRAIAVGREDWLVWGYNQLANCLLDESRFSEACAEYRRALALVPDEPSVARANVLTNLGYCLMLRKGVAAGLPLTFRALRWFRRFGTRIFEVWPELDLCYAYIELGRFDRAREHGKRALALAESSGETDRVKNALYLLGDAEREAGDLDSAYEYFYRLQQRFYPDSPQLVDMMVAVGMRQMVNLRA